MTKSVPSVKEMSSKPRVAFSPAASWHEPATTVSPAGSFSFIWIEPSSETGPIVIVNVISSPAFASVLSAVIFISVEV